MQFRPLTKQVMKQPSFINEFHSNIFIGKQEARFLLETLKSPSIMSIIPKEATNIIMVYYINDYRELPMITSISMSTKRKMNITVK